MRTLRLVRQIGDALPDGARLHFDAALAGDAAAARALIDAAPKRFRGHIAVLAYEMGVANPAYREIVGAVWRRDPKLLADFWPQATVRRVIARADFDVSGMKRWVGPNGDVIAYRGGFGTPARQVAAGLCWYFSRADANRLAMRRKGAAGMPRLLRAVIKPADIIYWGEVGGGQGIVTRAPVAAVAVGAHAPLLASSRGAEALASVERGGSLPALPRLMSPGLRPDVLPKPQGAAGASVGVREGAEHHVHVM